ncbi:hypothetical protein WISP_66750 [Willisornis vidua]|uniref:Uncharacterized protein n=1 Tax=Willisornis vidua TaxID=1566151 RepID=A0ABQ9DDD0_9PASS|nr:hypothetical protein WISP_66750 [Willisornis vidua]
MLITAADPVTTILSPFTWNSAGLENCAFTAQSNASAEAILDFQLIIPHGADQLLFSDNLHRMDNAYIKISDVTVPLMSSWYR